MYIRLSKFLYIGIRRRPNDAYQKVHGTFCLHRFTNSRNYILYLGPIIVSLEELMDQNFRPVRLRKRSKA